jgi:histidinol phosphatase-like enzyme (inositol monophosphatase family)
LSELATLAAFAEELAEVARLESLRWSRADWAVEDKGGGGAFDPVTRADRAVERAMRDLIQERWPDHGIEGEEFGAKTCSGRYRWSLDPIDGTRSFICGLPTWTVLIALLDEGRPVIGVIDSPRLNERFVAYAGAGLLVDGTGRTPLRASQCRRVREARLSTTDPYLFSAGDRAGFERVREEARLTRYGLDGYAYGCLAAGGLDLIIESGLAPHDMNALLPVVEGAGGAVSNWCGGADLSEGKLVAAASLELLEETVGMLSTLAQ